jgi:outer membrane protein assembly factor BamA
LIILLIYQPKYANDVLSSIIGESNVTFYLDGGNAFNWLINEEYNQNFSFGKFAYSVGFGYGYKTPLGPLRIDYAVPLYGPPNSPVTLEDYQSFANPTLRINVPGWIGTGSFHIALGYAF